MTISVGQGVQKDHCLGARSWTWSRIWTGSCFVRKSFSMGWGVWESFCAWRRAGCGSDEGRTDTLDSQWCPCSNWGGFSVGDCPGRALAAATPCVCSSVRVSVPHAWATGRREWQHVAPFKAFWGTLHTCPISSSPLTKWQKLKSDLQLPFACLNRPGCDPSSHALLLNCIWQPRLAPPGLGGPHPAATLIISLQLIMSVSVWEASFLNGKVRKQLKLCDFLRYYIHYFLINVIVRFSHDTTGAWTEITAEQSPFTSTGPLSLSPTPFCNILWFWQKLSFWNLKELY